MNHKGTVYSAKCQCKAGLGETCSHVAVHFQIEDFKRLLITIPEDVTVTGKLQTWHVPSMCYETSTIQSVGSIIKWRLTVSWCFKPFQV